MKTLPIAILVIATGLACASDKPGYKLGDRLAPESKKAAPAEAYRSTRWEELVPKGWDPLKEFRAMDLDRLQDGDPEANRLLQNLRSEWDRAPANADFNGKRIRIPGFVVPLEREGERVKEFLLVPYFGACIHSPPPPANQIVHAIADKPIDGLRAMSAIWANGVLEIHRVETWMGNAGYRMKVHETAPYTSPGAR